MPDARLTHSRSAIQQALTISPISPTISMPSDADLNEWLRTQLSPAPAQPMLWIPSPGATVRIRSAEHLVVLMSGLHRQPTGFASVEWRGGSNRPWVQTAPQGHGLIIEVNEGVTPEGRTYPCTRRAFKGNPGDYPPPDESDPRYKTRRYPHLDIETFHATEGADLIWTWMHSSLLPPGISVTMRHFGAKERHEFDCGDL